MKAALGSVLAALLGLVIKRNQPELALLLALSALLAILAGAISLWGELRVFLTELTEGTALNEALLSPLVKCLVLSVTARLAADVCKDAGSAALASAVELVGAAAGVVVSLPLLRAVLQMIRALL